LDPISLEYDLNRERINGSDGQINSFFQINFQIIWTMGRELTGFALIKDICKLLIFWRYSRKVRGFGREGDRPEIQSSWTKVNTELLGTFHLAGPAKGYCIDE
jgi:hypothetical protein